MNTVEQLAEEYVQSLNTYDSINNECRDTRKDPKKKREYHRHSVREFSRILRAVQKNGHSIVEFRKAIKAVKQEEQGADT